MTGSYPELGGAVGCLDFRRCFAGRNLRRGHACASSDQNKEALISIYSQPSAGSIRGKGRQSNGIECLHF